MNSANFADRRNSRPVSLSKEAIACTEVEDVNAGHEEVCMYQKCQRSLKSKVGESSKEQVVRIKAKFMRSRSTGGNESEIIVGKSRLALACDE